VSVPATSASSAKTTNQLCPERSTSSMIFRPA
jgi:hypothetical protein